MFLGVGFGTFEHEIDTNPLYDFPMPDASLTVAKNPGQDAILGDFVFWKVELITHSIYL